MATYSNSKISTFETCPYQYKLHYIDRIEPEIETTIEAFMGDLVHQTLEKLYKDKKFKKRVEKKILIKFYRDLWEKEYSEDILIAKEDEGMKADNYRKMGEKYISDYYDSYKNDDMIILGLETQDRLTLPDGNQWHVRIDKLGCDKQGNYFVCDYKTNARIKLQEEADSDRQLAMYSIWVKDKFKDARKVILKWHMLAFDKEITSERTDEQLKALQQEIIEKIQEIQEATKENDFPTNPTKLCDWCRYKSECPSFKHLAKIEDLPVEKFKKDDGVNLVDEYSEVKKKLGELEEKKEEFGDKLIEFSKQLGVDAVYGSNNVAKVREFDKIVMPEGEDKADFIKLMKDKGIYEECSMVCYPKLNSKVLKGEVEDEISDKVKIEKDWRISLSRRRDVGEGEE